MALVAHEGALIHASWNQFQYFMSCNMDEKQLFVAKLAKFH